MKAERIGSDVQKAKKAKEADERATKVLTISGLERFWGKRKALR